VLPRALLSDEDNVAVSPHVLRQTCLRLRAATTGAHRHPQGLQPPARPWPLPRRHTRPAAARGRDGCVGRGSLVFIGAETWSRPAFLLWRPLVLQRSHRR